MANPVGSFLPPPVRDPRLAIPQGGTTQMFVEQGPYGMPGSPIARTQVPPKGASPWEPQYDPMGMKVQGYLGAASSGFGAGSQVAPTPSAGEAALQVAGSTLSGAAQGAAVGSIVPGIGTAVGAGVGALAGLVTGGIGAYLGVKSARKKRREEERRYREIQAREDARAKQERADMKEAQGYNRRQNAIQSRYNSMQWVIANLNTAMSKDENLKNQFIGLGR